jgi:hypothetical protein
MKNIIKFNTVVLFGYATVLADIASLKCAIDNDSKVIWTNDLDGFYAAFEQYGIDPEEFSVTEGSKQEYAALAKMLAAQEEAAAVADEEGDNF